MTNIHITTCHHSTVRCRPRYCDYSRANIKEWTPEERLEISKISIKSLTNFCNIVTNKSIALLDDGSDMQKAIEWMDNEVEVNVIHFPHRGSSSGINDYISAFKNTIKDDDLIVHFEDDHIAFNPLKLNWAERCFQILVSETSRINHVGVITLRSGLPTDTSTPGYNGAWGPRGWISGDYEAPWFESMGNAHHIMLWKTYKQFFPLSGSSGKCEESMNIRLHQLGLKNIELQEHLYMFHSHMLNFKIDENNCSSNEWNLSGAGREYGIKDMDEYLRAKKRIEGITLRDRKNFEGTYFYD